MYPSPFFGLVSFVTRLWNKAALFLPLSNQYTCAKTGTWSIGKPGRGHRVCVPTWVTLMFSNWSRDVILQWLTSPQLSDWSIVSKEIIDWWKIPGCHVMSSCRRWYPRSSARSIVFKKNLGSIAIIIHTYRIGRATEKLQRYDTAGVQLNVPAGTSRVFATRRRLFQIHMTNISTNTLELVGMRSVTDALK